MMALYMPMQPSSKTPMIAFSSRSCRASAVPSSVSGSFGSGGRGRTWLLSWVSSPVSSQVRSPSRAQVSVKSGLHRTE